MNACTITKLVVGQMQENCYLIQDKETVQTIIVDPGDDGTYITDQLTKLSAIPVMIVATHGHFDHIMAAYELQVNFNIPFFIHPDDVFLLERMRESAKHFLGIDSVDPPPQNPQKLVAGQSIMLGKTTIQVLHTPGHTPGSVCLHMGDDALFVGDTIFAGGSVGRTDFQYSNHTKLMSSIQTILSYPNHVILYPGHGDDTIVEKERIFHTV